MRRSVPYFKAIVMSGLFPAYPVTTRPVSSVLEVGRTLTASTRRIGDTTSPSAKVFGSTLYNTCVNYTSVTIATTPRTSGTAATISPSDEQTITPCMSFTAVTLGSQLEYVCSLVGVGAEVAVGPSVTVTTEHVTGGTCGFCGNATARAEVPKKTKRGPAVVLSKASCPIGSVFLTTFAARVLHPVRHIRGPGAAGPYVNASTRMEQFVIDVELEGAFYVQRKMFQVTAATWKATRSSEATMIQPPTTQRTVRTSTITRLETRGKLRDASFERFVDSVPPRNLS
ncbi:hypothetical protein P692DRAFT_201811283 [Suillus brevipes Sb2]|nr:hypothetical protein P692DRAFT_201811283 [Suillus brevipes Sb2]